MTERPDAMKARIQEGPLDILELQAAVARPAHGGQALFVGVVRDSHEGRTVLAVTYECFSPLAEKILGDILREAGERWGACVAARHRVGRLAVGEASVAVAAAAPPGLRRLPARDRRDQGAAARLEAGALRRRHEPLARGLLLGENVKSPEQIRLYVFLSVLGFSALGEFLAPRRLLGAPRLWRWAINLSLLILDTVVVRIALPLLALDMAKLAEARGWGLLNHVSLHFGLKLAAAFLFLDFVIYVQHWTFHEVPWLWRLHKVHHTDLDLDVSSGVRFHPLEIILSMLIKLAAVAVIGAHFIAVLVFEAVLNATSLFNHANTAVPNASTGPCGSSSSPRTCTGFITARS
jgi:hypothetical protein